MRFRNLATATAGAVAAGALVFSSLATAAVAADAAPAGVGMDCAYDDYKLPYSTPTTAKIVGGKIVLDVIAMPGDALSKVPSFVKLKSLDATLSVTIDGAPVELKGSHTLAEMAPLSEGLPMPQFTADAPAGFTGGTVTITGMNIDAIANAFGSDTPAKITCTPGADNTFEVTGDEPAEPTLPDGTVTFACDGQFGAMVYNTVVKPTVTREGQNVKVAFTPEALPGMVPVAADANITVDATVLVNGAAATVTGTKAVKIGPRQPIELPAVAGTVATTATKIDVSIKDLTIKVMPFDMTFPCTLAAPVSVGSYTVAAAPVIKPPVVAKANSTTTAKVTVAKKSKKATVAATVKAGKANAAGKVTIKITKGKKSFGTKTVTLKAGKARFVSKKLAKGSYKATVSYAGNAKTKASMRTVSFKVTK